MIWALGNVQNVTSCLLKLWILLVESQIVGSMNLCWFTKFKEAQLSTAVKVLLFWFGLVWFMVLTATFNNISVISWRKPDYPEKNIDLSQVTDKLDHIVLYWEDLAMNGFKLTTLVVIGTDWTGSCKSNYHTIMAIIIL